MKITTNLSFLAALLLSPALYAADGSAFPADTVERVDNQLILNWPNMPAQGRVDVTWYDVRTKTKHKVSSQVNGDKITISDPNPDGRTAFIVPQTDGSSLLVAERKISVDGMDNLRDIGGYKTVDGKTVKWGYLYRSDQFSKLTPKGYRQFEKLNIGHIFDLRDDSEVAKKPDPAIDGIVYRHTEIPTSAKPTEKPSNAEQAIKMFSDPNMLNYWPEANSYMVDDKKAQQSVREIFMTTLNSDKAIVWHCAGGKDRTGFVSALLLASLGVPQQTIVDDYLLTLKYREAFDKQELEDMKKTLNNDPAAIQGFLAIQGSRPEYIGSALDKINSQYGSVDNYLVEQIGLTKQQLQQLKDRYTE